VGGEQAAVKRAQQLAMGVYLDPIYLGDWPQAYKDLVGIWLPPMSPQLRSWLNGTMDWFAMNYYTAM
jgi:beta-glucosidase/6-phospho-beta-glucosidase/beta-galactosidase